MWKLDHLEAVEVEVPCHSTEETGTTSMAEASQNSGKKE